MFPLLCLTTITTTATTTTTTKRATAAAAAAATAAATTTTAATATKIEKRSGSSRSSGCGGGGGGKINDNNSTNDIKRHALIVLTPLTATVSNMHAYVANLAQISGNTHGVYGALSYFGSSRSSGCGGGGGGGRNNDNNSNNDIQRCTSIVLTLLTATVSNTLAYVAKLVQITCNTPGAYGILSYFDSLTPLHSVSSKAEKEN